MNRNMTVRGLLTFAAAAGLLLAGAAAAQPSRPVRTLTEPAYRELRRLAQQLDARAEHAADQAEHDRYRLYRRDNTFRREVSGFARRANRFDARMARYRVEPWAMQGDVRALLRNARDIQGRVRQSRWVDEHTIGDWNEVVEIVNRMARVSDGRIDFGGYPGPGEGGPPPRIYERDPQAAPPQPEHRHDEGQPRPNERNPTGNPPAPDHRHDDGQPRLNEQNPTGSPPPPDHHRDEYGSRNPSAPGDSLGDQLAGLARELEDRATRALESAEHAAAENGPYRREFMQSIREFNTQAAAFRQGVGSGTNNPGQLRAEAGRLLDVARQNDQRMRQSNAFREVWPDWQGAMQTLQRILDLLR